MFSREIEGDRILKSSFVYLSEEGEIKQEGDQRICC